MGGRTLNLNFLTKSTQTEESTIVSELKRLNNNFERYLQFLKVPVQASEEQQKLSETPTLFVGEPLSELELALREHAEALGHEWKPTDVEVP
jgi:hypothetical protein